MSDYFHIPPEAYGSFFQGRQPNSEELRFWRSIEERWLSLDGTQEITLSCGHHSTQIIPFPDSQEYAPCSQCLRTALMAKGWTLQPRR
jgi:hypothetical protein